MKRVATEKGKVIFISEKQNRKSQSPPFLVTCFTTQSISADDIFVMNRSFSELWGEEKIGSQEVFSSDYIHLLKNDMLLESTIDLSQSWEIWRKVPFYNCWKWDNLDWLQAALLGISVLGVWHGFSFSCWGLPPINNETNALCTGI